MNALLDEFRTYLAGLRAGGAPSEAVDHLEGFAARFAGDDPPRRVYVFSLEAEETEEFSVTCTASEAAELVTALRTALPDVAVTADRIAQTDYSTETETVEKIAATIVADTGFISPAEPV